MIKFLNCQIDTCQKVLEPRLETEFWTEKAIAMIQKSKAPKILDIFSGSGCIGIAVLKNTKAFVDFVDISEQALEQIKINLELNGIKDRFNIILSDMFSELKAKKYDFILANPPYVALDRIKEVEPDVLIKEPKQALFAGNDGMFFIRKFLNEAKDYLNKDGIIFMEFDPLQVEAIKEVLEKNNLKTQFKKDQFDKTRFLICSLR